MTPEDLPRAIQSMLQALKGGQADIARARAEEILAAAPGEPNAAQVLALSLIREGKAAEALPPLLAADRAVPDHPHILNMLGTAFKQLGRMDEAEGHLERAIAADKTFLDARLNLGQLYLDELKLDKAAASFNAALDLAPQNATALAGRARAALLSHDNAGAKQFADAALAVQPGHVLAALTLAVARLRLEDFAGAIAIAEPLAQRTDVSPINRAYAAGFAADAYDRQDQVAEAFALYSLANDLQAEQFAELESLEASPFHPANVRAMTQAVKAEGIASVECPEGDPAPVFLVGFPRSGTTLLEQVLMSHPRLQSFGEHMALAHACTEFFVGPEAGTRFAALDEAGAARVRARYWQEAAKFGTLAPNEILLDKLPLNTIFLPAIAKVFPHAKIIFALRDPRDVVLSCLQQRFGMNVAMFQLLSIEKAARYYDLVLSLAKAARDTHTFPLMEVRYEDVVTDLEARARDVIAFLELDWDDAVLAYRENARSRAIDTPSVAQVIEPIYTRSRGKWRRYQDYLVPAEDHLAAWVERLGYADEEQ